MTGTSIGFHDDVDYHALHYLLLSVDVPLTYSQSIHEYH